MREYSFDSPLDRWHRTARTWFDGSIESVDCRLADCRRLLARSERAVGSNWGSDGMQAHIETIASLQDTQRVLEAQRYSLLTAGTDREARGVHDTLDVDFGENAPDHTNPYTGETGRRSQMTTHGDGSGYHINASTLVNFSRAISSSVSGAVEFWTDEDFDPANATRQSSVDLALEWAARRELQFDIGLNVGITRETPGLQEYVGVSFKL